MDEESFKKHKPYAGPAKPSMLRRRIGHDYSSRCIYLITMTTEGRRPVLGTLVGSAEAPAGSPEAPHIVLTPLGERIRQAWLNNEKHYKGVSVLATMVMPDHLHGIIFIREEATVDLGTIIKGFKAGCNKAYRELFSLPQGGSIERQERQERQEPQKAQERQEPQKAQQPQEPQKAQERQERQKAQQPLPSAYADTPCQQPQRPDKPKRDRQHGLLWSPQYNDHILEGAGELQRWRDYLRDNPRRLAIRRAHREYFRVQFNVTVAGRTYAAIGNRFLLDYPQKLQVQCSRSMTPAEIEAEVSKKKALAEKGVVMVSPGISDGEKAVMDAILEAGRPQIFLTPRGFNEYSRPGHRYYDACAEGRFLILAPWPHNNRETPLTRQMCLELNEMAREICEG